MRYMEYELKYIAFYVQKHIAPLAMCYNPRLVHDKPLGAPAFAKLIFVTYRLCIIYVREDNDSIV